MKLGIFCEAFDTANQPFEVQYARVGANSGNLVFLRSLRKIFDLTLVNPYYGYKNISEKYSDIDAFITTDLIWIRPETRLENVECLFSHIGDRPFIPISVGLQADTRSTEFKMHPKTVKLLSAISERCMIGVRGYYAAYVLNRYGIKNLAVIGCPSVFYNHEYRFREPEDSSCIKTVSSFKTAFYKDFQKWCSPKENEYLMYCMKYGMGFVEQTGMCEINRDAPFGEWINNKRKMFFDTDEWSDYIKTFDFHLGMRFHGGIIAMQNGLRSLLISSDSRTNELADFLCIPKLSISEFDASKPIEYYYEKADFSDFQKRFPYLKENFKAFAKTNGLTVKVK